MPFLSVIIPVYNVEKYLKECVDSVLNQNLEDVEIILVDDGSPDRCPQICDEYAQKNSNIRVIHKKNGGLSSARNAGIKLARGSYIMFLDSDDWWNPDVNVAEMLQTVKDNSTVDLFQFASMDYLEGNGYYVRSGHIHFDGIDTTSIESYYRSLLNRGNLEVHAGTKIIRTCFLLDNGLLFQEGIKSEDNEWILRLLRCLNSVKTIDERLYVYRAGREGSITQTIGKKNIEDLLWIVEKSIQYYQNAENKILMPLELDYASYLWFSALGLSSRLPKTDQAALKEKFDNTSEVCSFGKSPKTRLCSVVYKTLGFSITTSILGQYIAIKGHYQINKKKWEKGAK